jgi:DNA-binding transcriptional LysR family regulator
MVRAMYDAVTLDQLRALVTVAEEGSFSAAARRLKRVQSAISTSMANLESQLGVRIWDRSHKVATLTHEGRAVVAAAERVLAEADGLRRLAEGMEKGLEATVSLAIEALFPVSALVDLCSAFAREFPSVELRVDTEVMSAVAARVLSGAATLGVVGPHGLSPALARHPLGALRMLPVVSRSHPLADLGAKLDDAALESIVQIVLSERNEGGVPDQAVLSPRTWRVADLHTKHMMLRAGLGWGNLPEHLARPDIDARQLVEIRPSSWSSVDGTLSLSAVHKKSTVLGPAHLWWLERLKVSCAQPEPNAKEPPRRKQKRGHLET